MMSIEHRRDKGPLDVPSLLGNRAPQETDLENVLADCPAIAEAAVIGVDDATWGEAPCARSVVKPGRQIDERLVLDLFRERVAKFKHPCTVVFLER